jgi:FAS-associated factor 2
MMYVSANEKAVSLNLRRYTVAAARSVRTEQDFARRLREEQDAAFTASLEADAAREAAAAEAAAAAQVAAAAAAAAEAAEAAAEAAAAAAEEERLGNIARRREEQAAALREKEEPDAGTPGVCKVAVRLPDGSRKERRFLSADTVRDIYNFVDTLEGLGENYSLVSNFPRRVFSRVQDGATTLADGGLHPQAMLMYREDD